MNGKDKIELVEAALTPDDIKKANKKQAQTTKRTPDDKLFLATNEDPIKGRIVADLSMIQKIRRAHMAKRVGQQKRLKILQKVYKKPAEAGAGGLGL